MGMRMQMELNGQSLFFTALGSGVSGLPLCFYVFAHGDVCMNGSMNCETKPRVEMREMAYVGRQRSYRVGGGLVNELALFYTCHDVVVVVVVVVRMVCMYVYVGLVRGIYKLGCAELGYMKSFC
jgi:hypothetical protein